MVFTRSNHLLSLDRTEASLSVSSSCVRYIAIHNDHISRWRKHEDFFLSTVRNGEIERQTL